MYRTNEAIYDKFALRNPLTGARVTSGASFQITATDPNGADISSSVAISQNGTTNIYQLSFSPLLEGSYFVSVYESTTQQYIDGDYWVGGSLADRLWNLANQGQTVALGAGGGGFVYHGTISLAAAPQSGISVFVFAAQDSSGSDTNAVADISSLIAQAVTADDGSFSLSLAPKYYLLEYTINNIVYQSYIRWSSNRNIWVASPNPISVSQL